MPFDISTLPSLLIFVPIEHNTLVEMRQSRQASLAEILHTFLLLPDTHPIMDARVYQCKDSGCIIEMHVANVTLFEQRLSKSYIKMPIVRLNNFIPSVAVAVDTSVSGTMQTSTTTEDVVTHRYRKTIVLWDIEHCTISKTFPIVTLLQNINEVLAHAIGYGWKPIDVERRVYINYKSKNTHHPSPAQYRDIQKECTVIPFTKKGTADVHITTDMAEIERTYQNVQPKPVIVLITGDRDYLDAIQGALRSGFEVMILLHILRLWTSVPGA
jgi:hypothetical protein